MRRVTKARPTITIEEVSIVFDDARIGKLATKLPPNADINAFTNGIREAARIFAHEACEPTANELRVEIAEFLKAAEQGQYDQAADLREKLSAAARDMLGRHSLTIDLPPADALRDPARRKQACDAIARLCQIGGRYVAGRKRTTGKRSRSWQPLLNAPDPRRNFAKREAERNFVMWLQIAWLDATGKQPAHTARHSDASRGLGPFADFAHECLKLVGVGHADAVGLINELERGRKSMNACHIGTQAVMHQSLTDRARQ